ncbi:hypothetical protein ACQFX9_14255 [Aliinostoc sp. HNIBRCY26]|uniref:hypothetical protein n=1 Tax=Aliinostoc sp. HNIBRCY26 TaxID=3418997 RepID=UPI003D040BF6
MRLRSSSRHQGALVIREQGTGNREQFFSSPTLSPLSSQSPIPIPQSPVPNPQYFDKLSTSPQSPIPNPQSPIPSPQ